MSRKALKKLIDDGCTLNVVYHDGFDWITDVEASRSPNQVYKSLNEIEESLVEVFKDSLHMGNIQIIDEGDPEEHIVDYHCTEYLERMLG
jgi:hypothetical protein